MAGLSSLPGVGAALISKLIEAKTWTLLNTETGEFVQGQFPAEDNGFSAGANWAELQMLTRPNPVLQFLNGKTEAFTFASRFFRAHASDSGVHDRIDTLEGWTKAQPKTGRPPLLRFVLGDGAAVDMQCVIVAIPDIAYSLPDKSGGVRQVKFSLSLLRTSNHDLSDRIATDTRFHRAKDGESYELIAQREYGNAILGDLIRKQPEQSGKALLTSGDVVKLPALQGIRRTKIRQRSLILNGAYSAKGTQQKTLRKDVEGRNAGPFERYIYDAGSVKDFSAPVPPVITQPYLYVARPNVGFAKVNPVHGQFSVEHVQVAGEREFGYGLAFSSHDRLGVTGLWSSQDQQSEQSDSVLGWDLKKHTVSWPRAMSQALEGNAARGTLVGSDGNFWLTRGGGNFESIRKIDSLSPSAAQLNSISTPDLGDFGACAVVDYEDNRIYALSTFRPTLVSIDMDTETIVYETGDKGSVDSARSGLVRRRPQNKPDPRELYCALTNGIRIFDCDTGNTVGSINGTDGDYIAYDPIRDEMWTAGYFGQVINRIDCDSRTVISTTALPQRPEGIFYEPPSSGDFGTAGNRVWYNRLTGARIWTLCCVDPENPGVELEAEALTIADVNANSPQGHFAYSTAADGVPSTFAGIDTDAPVPYTPETWQRPNTDSLLVGLWRPGAHNVVSGDRYERIFDLSGNGFDLTPAGGLPANRPTVIEADPLAGDHPGMIFDGTNHLVANLPLSGAFTDIAYRAPSIGSTYFWTMTLRLLSAQNDRALAGWFPESSGQGTGMILSGANNRFKIRGSGTTPLNGIVLPTNQTISVSVEKHSFSTNVQLRGAVPAVTSVSAGSAGGSVLNVGLSETLEVGNSQVADLNGLDAVIYELAVYRYRPESAAAGNFHVQYCVPNFRIGL